MSAIGMQNCCKMGMQRKGGEGKKGSRENEMRWVEESGRELGLGTALICNKAAWWISGWQTLLWILLSMRESVYSSKKAIFAWEDFLLCRESVQATKKAFFFLFFYFPFPLLSQLLFAFVFFNFLSFVLFSSFLVRSLLESATVVVLKCLDKANASMLFAITSVRKTDGHVQMRKDWEITLTLCHRFPKEPSHKDSGLWK